MEFRHNDETNASRNTVQIKFAKIKCHAVTSWVCLLHQMRKLRYFENEKQKQGEVLTATLPYLQCPDINYSKL